MLPNICTIRGITSIFLPYDRNSWRIISERYQLQVLKWNWQLKSNLYTIKLLKDSEVFDGGTSRVTSCREYRKTGMFWGGLYNQLVMEW